MAKVERNVIVEVKPGRGDRKCYLYTDVRDAETGELLQSAVIEYTIQAARERNWYVVEWKNAQ
jgi:hypothetical protein